MPRDWTIRFPSSGEPVYVEDLSPDQLRRECRKFPGVRERVRFLVEAGFIRDPFEEGASRCPVSPRRKRARPISNGGAS